MPTHYQMYVQAMKNKGTTVTWENWIQTASGTLLPTNHRYLSGKIINMGEVKGYN